MDITEKAKELGQMIAESSEYKRLIKAEMTQNNDKEAQALINAYNDKRKNIAENMKGKELSQDEMNAVKEDLQKAFDSLSENLTVKEFIAAKKGFDELMQSVNSIISYYVTGEEPANCSPSKCNSCSGCQ